MNPESDLLEFETHDNKNKLRPLREKRIISALYKELFNEYPHCG